MRVCSNKKIYLFSLYLFKIIPSAFESITIGKDNVIFLNLKKNIVPLLITLIKNHTWLQCTSLLDIWAVDHLEKADRFEVNYMILSYLFEQRFILRLNVKDGTAVQSVKQLFSSAGWLEREVWDLFGIFFSGHSDLRRILTDYGFSGYPLRRDFPISGYFEVRYDDKSKKVISEPIEISQEFRSFSFVSPWEL